MEKQSTQEIKERVQDKIEEIEEFLSFLLEITPKSFEDYKTDLKAKAACERYAEKIIEAIVDLAFLTAKFLNIEIPAQISDKEIFDLLSNKKIISSMLSSNLQHAKGMRNIIEHEYGKLNDERVYEALSTELESDVNEFLANIKNSLDNKNKEK